MWLETILTLDAAAGFWLSAFNAICFWQLTMRPSSRGRRLVGRVLAGVCGAQAAESLLFLWSVWLLSPYAVLHGGVLLAVRTLLLATAAALALLLLGARWREREEDGDDAP